MSTTYIYKITSKYKKNPELLERFGFHLYEDVGDVASSLDAKESEELERFYATGISLPLDSEIPQHLIKVCEKIHLKDPEAVKELEFDLENKLVLTEDLASQFTRCQLCFATSGLGEYSLFINAPDRVEYYSTEMLDKLPIVSRLVTEKVVYKKKVEKGADNLAKAKSSDAPLLN